MSANTSTYTISINLTGRYHLILPLGYTNSHIYKEKIKFGDWKCFEQYLEGKKDYLFKFNLKTGGHHVDIVSWLSWIYCFSFCIYCFNIWFHQRTIYHYKSNMFFDKILENKSGKNSFLDDGLGIEQISIRLKHPSKISLCI